MRVTMKTSAAEELLAVLMKHDQDVAMKFSDLVRRKIAINIQSLRPHVEAYQSTKNNILTELQQASKEDNTVNLAEFTKRDAAQRAMEVEVKLHRVLFADLRATRGEHVVTGLAAMAPMIRDFDDIEVDAEDREDEQ